MKNAANARGPHSYQGRKGHQWCMSLLQKVAPHPLVLVLRDEDTVEALAVRIKAARRVVLVGNGGIALELAFYLKGVEVNSRAMHSHAHASVA